MPTDTLLMTGSAFMIRALREYRAAELVARIAIFEGQRDASLAVVKAYQDQADNITAEIEATKKLLNSLDNDPIVGVLEKTAKEAQEQPSGVDKTSTPAPTPDPEPASTDAFPDAYVKTASPDDPQPTFKDDGTEPEKSKDDEPKLNLDTTTAAKPAGPACLVCSKEMRPPNLLRHTGACAAKWVGDKLTDAEMPAKVIQLLKTRRNTMTAPDDNDVNYICNALRKRREGTQQAADTALNTKLQQQAEAAATQKKENDEAEMAAAQTGIPPETPLQMPR